MPGRFEIGIMIPCWRLVLAACVLVAGLCSGCSERRAATVDGAEQVRNDRSEKTPDRPSDVQPGSPAAEGVERAPAVPAEETQLGDEPRGDIPDIAPKWYNDWKDLGTNLGDDVVAVFDKENFLYNFIVLGGAGALTGASIDQWDKRVARDFERHDRLGAGDDIGSVMGNPGTHFGVMGVLYSYGRLAKDAKAVEASRRLAEALIINDLVTLTLKLSTGRNRPDGRHFSFPSGHVSSTFAMAAALDGMYGPVVGVPLYALGCFVGLSRLDKNKHYLSDVIFGAALGYVIGRTVNKAHDRKIFGFEAEPWVDEDADAAGLLLRRRF